MHLFFQLLVAHHSSLVFSFYVIFMHKWQGYTNTVGLNGMVKLIAAPIIEGGIAHLERTVP
jgi:hypothetical protein